jgi:hypothetical protein
MTRKLPTKIEDLRKECVRKGLPINGTAKVLKDRLKEFDTQEKSDLFHATITSSSPASPFFRLTENTFLLQMKLANVAMYFVHGYLYPMNLEISQVYKEQNRTTDLLTQFDDYLPLAKGVVEDFDESQILIEIILTKDEASTIVSIGDLNFFNGPLPVSRISALYFANNSVRSSFLASVDIFPDAYIPHELCSIIPDKIETVKIVSSALPIRSLSHWRTTLGLYNRLLGMIAFLKNTSLLYSNRTNEYLDYTPSYFQVLSYINNYEDLPQKENSFFKWMINPETIEIDGKLPRFQFKEILKAIYADVEFDIDWGIQLLENSAAFEQNQEQLSPLREIVKIFINYKKMRIDYRTVLSHPLIQKNIPIIILVFLIKFPNKGLGHSDKQAVKNYFKSSECIIEHSVAEYIFATLGLYYGYCNMVKEDHFELFDPLFNKLAKESGQIKFKLDSFLDRFTIESVFRFSKDKTERLKDGFDFLNMIKSPTLSKLQLLQSTEAEYIDESYVKFGKRITSIRRFGINVLLAKELTKTYEQHITQKEHLFTYVAKHYPELLTIDRDKLAEIIAATPFNKTLMELRDTIELDKKYGRNIYRR